MGSQQRNLKKKVKPTLAGHKEEVEEDEVFHDSSFNWN